MLMTRLHMDMAAGVCDCVCVCVCLCVCVCVCLCVCVALQTFEFHTFQQARLAVGLRECRGLLHKWKRRRDSARHEHEGREIRTPNLLIWSQTRCRCAIPPASISPTLHYWLFLEKSRRAARPRNLASEGELSLRSASLWSWPMAGRRPPSLASCQRKM
jgi:hypothetical protein